MQRMTYIIYSILKNNKNKKTGCFSLINVSYQRNVACWNTTVARSLKNTRFEFLYFHQFLAHLLIIPFHTHKHFLCVEKIFFLLSNVNYSSFFVYLLVRLYQCFLYLLLLLPFLTRNVRFSLFIQNEWRKIELNHVNLLLQFVSVVVSIVVSLSYAKWSSFISASFYFQSRIYLFLGKSRKYHSNCSFYSILFLQEKQKRRHIWILWNFEKWHLKPRQISKKSKL